MINIKRMTKENKLSLLQQVYQLAYQYEQDKHCCSQCTVSALQYILALPDKGLSSAAYILGGGFNLTGNGTCGALAGGAMMMSYLYGRTSQEFMNNIKHKQSHELTQRLYNQFTQKYDGCLCKEVQQTMFGRSFDFRDMADQKAFKQAGAHEDKCPSVVATTAQWTLDIILQSALLWPTNKV